MGARRHRKTLFEAKMPFLRAAGARERRASFLLPLMEETLPGPIGLKVARHCVSSVQS